ncbi:MAG: DUF934 domain-containing protein [Pseudomonadota bacterium]|nr:DUF934 domain-containing protein [Pseudomonadota bacterium]
MPRRLLRDGRVVEDDWTYLAGASAPAANGTAVEGLSVASDTSVRGGGAAVAGGAATAGEPAPSAGLIITFDQWLADKPRWLETPARLGVVLSPADQVERLAPDLARFELIGAHFPGPSEGRGYTQGRLLRERYGWQGELRATGYVRRDQVFFLARCGFNSFELPDGEFDAAVAAFSTFSAEYQPSNDAGLAIKLRRR